MIDIEKVIEGKESDWNWIVLLLDILDCYVLVKGKQVEATNWVGILDVYRKELTKTGTEKLAIVLCINLNCNIKSLSYFRRCLVS